ncbi:RNA polymerase subunit sigma-70 [Planomonospora parontospora]|uniref:RNA polymerase subunit sigma-70 n=1 Tax=Planomonospora parontospora TaxID=58119 RepID=UPI001EF6F511|nr:RNA polymerase subunit sigma-70 [Planomonospora parontospora]
MRELIADIERRARELAPGLPEAFYADVTELSSSVGRLRRIARIARDAAQTGAGSPAPCPAEEIVTPAPVTEKPSGRPGPGTAGGFGPEAAPGAEGEAGTGSEAGTGAEEDAEVVAAVNSGDEWAFAGLAEPYRAELQLHCYRMVGSYDDSADLVQETFLRAWRNRDGFRGRSSLRAWLYRIATNACLDFLRRNTRRPQRYEGSAGGAEPPARITWLQPYPDHLLEDAAGAVSASAGAPEEAALSRETVELVFLTAIQHLPPRQRAVLVVRDVLGWPAGEAAELLEMSTASANSALARARATLREHLPRHRAQWTAPAAPSRDERVILQRYMDAADRADAAAVAELLRQDALVTMPPGPLWVAGRDAIEDALARTYDPASPAYFGRWRHLPTRANGRPAAAGYVQRPGTAVYRAQVLDVLRIENGMIVEITAFEPHLFPAFGLPLTLPAANGD